MQTLFQTDIARIADDQVIQQIDFQQICRLYQLSGKINIFGRGCGITARMVVTYENVRLVEPTFCLGKFPFPGGSLPFSRPGYPRRKWRLPTKRQAQLQK